MKGSDIMSRIATNVSEVDPQQLGDFAMTGAGPDVGGIVESAENAPDCTDLFRRDKTYSDRKLERLSRRFGLPFNYLGQPDVDAASCLSRSAEFVRDRKYVSAKKVLEIGMNDAVVKTAEETGVLNDLAEILEDFIQIDNDILSVGGPYGYGGSHYGFAPYPGDIWSLGGGFSYETYSRSRELDAYGWESRLTALKGRLIGYISGFVRTPVSDAASELALALNEAIGKKLAALDV